MDSITAVKEIDSYGYVTGMSLSREAKVLDRLKTVKRDPRLPIDPSFPLNKISLEVVKDTVMVMAYSPDGNILSKTGVGAYTYATGVRPHAVVAVDNADGRIPTSTLATTFNALDRIQTIADGTTGLSMEFDYGPDIQRWVTKLKSHGQDSITTVYAGNYEKKTSNGLTREFYYLDGGIIVVKQNGVFRPFISFTDYQGSILSMFDKDGTNVFKASYDAWGQQSVTVNTIGLRRGYTGHEMLPEFGIINMNGRLYDPVLGRFFSPDPFVQMPGSPQGFNRYSYCLNNPLKYTDPSGQFLSPALLFGIFNLASSMMQAAANGGNVWKAGALSILSSAATYGVGQLFGNASSLGKELLRAGAHGTASGVLSILSGGNFCKSFIAGAVASGTGRIAQCFTSDKLRVVAATTIAGGLSALLTGDNFMAGALSGMKIGLLNDCEHMEDDPIKDLPKDELYLDESGNVRYNYSETVICTGMPVQEMQDGNFQTNTPLDDLSHANIIVDSYGMAMLNFGGNSTIASNGKPYYHFKGEPTFNGNQYVQVRHVTEIGASITKYTKPMGRLGGPLNTLNVANGLIQDLQSPDQGFYNTSKASSQVLFSWAGASLGAQVGSEIGGMIGAYDFGAGAIPGYLLGAFIGGIAGGFGGDWFGAQVTDEIYGR